MAQAGFGGLIRVLGMDRGQPSAPFTRFVGLREDKSSLEVIKEVRE